MERTLVILKPGCLQRGLVGEVISRFEKRGLKLVAMKMVQLDEEILKVHYAHLLDKPFFPWLRDGMMAAPVILCCWEGYSAVQVVRDMAGATRASKAVPGTIRGDYSLRAHLLFEPLSHGRRTQRPHDRLHPVDGADAGRLG